MIRKISVRDLVPGMYVVDVHKPWLEHNLWRSRFEVRDEAHCAEIAKAGITELSIDTSRGYDVPLPQIKRAVPVQSPRPEPVRIPTLTERLQAKPRHVSLGEERRRAARLLGEANGRVSDLFLAARYGRRIDVASLEPVIEKMIDSITRNPDALVPLARLKQSGSYASEHAIATSALIIALGKQAETSLAELERLALGTLLKDIGEAAIDAKLIGKRGMLSRTEYSVVQSHVEEGLAVLEATSRLSETSVAVVLEHHERYNGSGYPYRMAGEEISAAGRMAAVADAYDAMTSDRPYRPALSPAVALRQLYDQGGTQFDPAMVAAFIRTVGVYPVGTLVRLESGHLAVVEAVHHDNLLNPVVRVIYHAGRQQYIAPVKIDLARKFGNHYGQIVGPETFERWGLSPLRWQPA